MRITLAAICIALIAGCSSGSDQPSDAAMVATATASDDDGAELKTSSLPPNRVALQYDVALGLINKLPAPSSNPALSEKQIRLVGSAFDRIGDAALSL